MGKKEVATTGGSSIALPEAGKLKEIMEANLEGLKPEFPVIKMPSGGGLAFEVPSDTDRPDIKQELVGVLLEHYTTRAYWDRSFEDSAGERNPPNCSSLGGKEGVGNPGGACHECPLNQWDTGRNGRGKACQERHRIFMLTGESIFPIIVSAPPTSLKNLSVYATKLAGKMKHLSTVLTKVTLKKDRNQDGIDYSKLEFSNAGDLDEENLKKVEAVGTALRRVMREHDLVDAELAEAGAKSEEDHF